MVDTLVDILLKPDPAWGAPIYIILYGAIGSLVCFVLLKFSSICLSNLSPVYRGYRINRMRAKLEFMNALSNSSTKLFAYVAGEIALVIFLFVIFVFCVVDSSIGLSVEVIVTSMKSMNSDFMRLFPMPDGRIVYVDFNPIWILIIEAVIGDICAIFTMLICFRLFFRMRAVRSMEKYRNKMERRIEKLLR